MVNWIDAHIMHTQGAAATYLVGMAKSLRKLKARATAAALRVGQRRAEESARAQQQQQRYCVIVIATAIVMRALEFGFRRQTD